MIGTFLPFTPEIKEGIGELFTFPITVSLEEPQNPSVGDIWVKTDKTFSKMHFTDAIGLNEENDTLIFLINNEFEYSLKGKYTISNSNMSECFVEVKTFNINNGSQQYPISDITENNFTMNFLVSRPKVYSKKDNNVIMEDAYIYSDQGWNVISRKSTLIILGSGYSTTESSIENNPSLYNNIDGELSFIEYVGGTAVTGGTSIQTFNNPDYVLITYTKDKTAKSGIYKLNGDHLEEYFIFSETMNLTDGENPGNYTCLAASVEGDKYINSYRERHVCANDDFSELLVIYIKTPISSTKNVFRVVRFINNGNTFVFDKTIIEVYSTAEYSRYNHTLIATNDLSFLLFSYGYYSIDFYYAKVGAYFRNKDNNNYTEGTCGKFNNTSPFFAAFNSSKTLCLTYGNPFTSNVGAYPTLLKIDYDKKTAQNVTANTGTKVENLSLEPTFRLFGNFSIPDDENFWVYYFYTDSNYNGKIFIAKISTSTFVVEKQIELNKFMDVEIYKQTGFTSEWGRNCSIYFSKDLKFLFICNGKTKRILVFSVNFDRETETISLTLLSNTIGATNSSASSSNSSYFCLPLGTDPVHFN